MFLGIDIGTTKVAAVLVDGDRSVIASASREHGAASAAAGLPGRGEQSVSRLLDCAYECVRELPAADRARVQAVGVTGQMHGVTVLDKANGALTPLITWQDQRCTDDPAFLPAMAERTGHRLSPGFGCATLAWLSAHGSLPAGAASSSTIHDLLVARLCGNGRPVTDSTDAASWGLFDLPSLDWDRTAVARAGIAAGLLPQVRPTGSLAGAVSDGMAASLGIPVDTPVAVAVGDNQASLIATLSDPDTDIALTLGTGGQLSVAVPRATAIDWSARPATCEYRPFVNHQYIAVASALCGGAGWAWLADTVAAWMRDLGAAPLDRDRLYQRLDDLGLASGESLSVSPHFLGERHDPALRCTIAGITLTNSNLGSLARGLARGIIANLRDMAPASLLAGRSRVVASGNALRRSRLLRHMAGEVFGLPVVLSEGKEEAATGAALLAGRRLL